MLPASGKYLSGLVSTDAIGERRWGMLCAKESVGGLEERVRA